MKALNKTLLALLATTAMTAGANAALYTNTGTATYAGQPYVGVKAGQFNVDADNADNPTAYGVYGGYNFTPNFGAEVEYMGSSDADLGTDSTLNAQTVGAYGTYRYNFPASPVYAKGKLGFAQTKLKAENKAGTSSYEADDTGVAGGVGLGYNFAPNMSVEAEYAMLPSVEDVDTNLWTIGAHYKF